MEGANGSADVLVKLYEVQQSVLLHTEGQRATITNLVMLIAAGIIGFIGQRGMGAEVLPLSMFLAITGAFGLLSAAKLYERYELSLIRSQYLRKRLDELCPEAHIGQLWLEAEAEHSRKRAVLSRLRLHWMWYSLYVIVIGAGLLLAAASYAAP